jgi:FKBP-type peptidyl-prolyl cis-trans isomerase
MLFRITILLILLPLMFSCRSNEPGPAVNGKPEQNQMEELNRYLIRKDRERIQNYIERKGLQMTESPTGLWYQIIRQGEGNFIKENSRIVIEYDCSLLDGTKCYSSEEMGPMDVIHGRSNIAAGLNEGLRLLKPGAKAIFILPPFLAFGLPGDGKKIPPGSVVIYNVNILRAE